MQKLLRKIAYLMYFLSLCFSVCRMKCRGTVNGKECGSILPENAPFCHDCGTAAGAIHCQCGVTVRGEHKFCHNCGAPVQLTELPASTPNVCPAQLPDGTPCGFTLLQGLNFCPNCGTRWPAEEQRQTQDPGEAGAKQRDDHSNIATTPTSSSDSKQHSDATGVSGASGGDGELIDCTLLLV